VKKGGKTENSRKTLKPNEEGTISVTGASKKKKKGKERSARTSRKKDVLQGSLVHDMVCFVEKGGGERGDLPPD